MACATAASTTRYAVSENDTWRDNPLIEALPGILTDDEFARAVRFFPPQSPELRGYPKHLRLMYIQRALQFFTPMENHLLLQQRVARVIRDGYVARNPVKDLGWNRLHRQLDELAEKLKYGVAPHEPPSALGFSLIGIGGIGKTIGMNAIMRTYPQMLIHRSYTDSTGREHLLTRSQIVFLKLDCPNDGTLKSLCLNFFQAVDRMTGCTRYYCDYGFKGSKQRTARHGDAARHGPRRRLAVHRALDHRRDSVPQQAEERRAGADAPLVHRTGQYYQAARHP